MQCTSTTCRDAGCRRKGRDAGCRRRGHRGGPRRGRGFTLISALFIIVVLAALGAALAKISVRQHLGSAAEIEAARAYQGARAGLEWAAYQVQRVPAPPGAAPACFSTSSFALAGHTVTVSCSRTPASGSLSEGSTTLVFYQLVSTACNAPSGGACPASGPPAATYVERQLSWTVTR
jgi:MSHA biogenesis protein MshP